MLPSSINHVKVNQVTEQEPDGHSGRYNMSYIRIKCTMKVTWTNSRPISLRVGAHHLLSYSPVWIQVHKAPASLTPTIRPWLRFANRPTLPARINCTSQSVRSGIRSRSHRDPISRTAPGRGLGPVKVSFIYYPHKDSKGKGGAHLRPAISVLLLLTIVDFAVSK